MKEKVILRMTKTVSIFFDDDDFEKLGHLKWHVNGCGYAQRYNPETKKHEYLHRVILGFTSEDKNHVDHINGNRLDNRKENLRGCSPSKNLKNGKGHRGSFCEYKGVSRDKDKFRANIMCNGKRISLGSFSSEIEAARAYDAAAIKLHGEFGRINF